MSIKHRLFYGTLAIHQAIAKKMGGRIRFVPDYLNNPFLNTTEDLLQPHDHL